MFIIKSFTFNPVQENTYILYNEAKDCIIIDPGCYFDDEKRQMEQYIENEALHPVWLLNTHCHLDHVFGNKYMAEKYHLTLHAHSLERPVLEMAPASGLMYELPFDNYQGPVKWMEEGDTINIDTDTLQCIHVPGHSPGSLCFLCADQHFLIGGDVLFRNSIGRTDLPGGSHEQLLRGIREKLFTLPPETVVYPGHGPATTIGEEMESNPFLN